MFAPASEADAEKVLSELSNELMSPYCPGRTIASCPSENARKLEDHILAEAKAGKSRKEIEGELVDRFGAKIVGYAPQPVVMYGAAAIGLVGLALVVSAGRKWMRRGARASAASEPAAPKVQPTAAERARLEDAIDDADEF
jgi:cytochrome c-type biogenesis protein CcmH/NrfF